MSKQYEMEALKGKVVVNIVINEKQKGNTVYFNDIQVKWKKYNDKQ